MSESAGDQVVRFYMPEMGPLAISRLIELLTKGGPISGDGPVGRAVEAQLSELHDGSDVLLTSSCTHALEMAAIMLRRPERTRVLVPSYSFSSCAAAFDLHGWEVAFTDVRRDTLTIDPKSIEEALTPNVGAIVHVNYGGFAPDIDHIRDLCNGHDVALIEDNAHGLGGRSQGRALGTWGDVSTLSFHGSKNLTCGEGGALVLPQESPLLELAYLIREKGTNRRAFFEGKVDKYTWVSQGSSYVLSDMAAAVLSGNLEGFSAVQTRRRLITREYSSLAEWASRCGFSLPPVPYTDPHFPAHLFWLAAPDEETRILLENHLRLSGVETATHYQALHESPYARHRLLDSSRCLVSSSASRQLLRLPLYSRLSDMEVHLIIEAVKSFS